VPGGTRAESGGRQGSGQSGARCFFALDHLFLAMDKLRRPRILTLKLGGIEQLVFVEKTVCISFVEGRAAVDCYI
jgi:hypothetical protein